MPSSRLREALVSRRASRSAPTAPAIAYLSSNLPSRSQTFVYQEVFGLRMHGARVMAATLRRNFLLQEVEAQLGGVHAIVDGWLLVRAAVSASRHPRASFAALAPLVSERHASVRAAARAAYHAAIGLAFAPWLRSTKIVYLHAHHAGPPAVVAMVAARASGIPFGFTAHGSDVRVRPELLGLKARSAAVVIAASESTRTHLASAAPDSADRIRVVRCGVPLERFRVHREPRHTGDPIRAVAVGRLSPEKDHVTMVRAMGVLRDRGVNASLDLVGEGPERKRIQDEIGALRLDDRVRLLGGVTNDLLPPLYSRSDLFLHSSVREGLPVVLVEALAAGLPVASTDVDGIPELIRDGQEGLLVPPRDPEALAGALARLSDRELMTLMGSRGPERARQHDLGVICRQLIDLFPVDLKPRPPEVPIPVTLVLLPGGCESDRRATVAAAAAQLPFEPQTLVCVGEPVRGPDGVGRVRHVPYPADAPASEALIRAARAADDEWLAPLSPTASWYPHSLALLWEARPEIARGVIAGQALWLAPTGEPFGLSHSWLSGGTSLVARASLLDGCEPPASDLEHTLERVARRDGLIRCDRVVASSASERSVGNARAAARYAADGLASIGVLPSAAADPRPTRMARGRPLRPLGEGGLGRSLLGLLRRPTAAAFASRELEALALRAIGVRPLRPDRSESQTRGARE